MKERASFLQQQITFSQQFTIAYLQIHKNC